jgi:hypothetical protein
MEQFCKKYASFVDDGANDTGKTWDEMIHRKSMSFGFICQRLFMARSRVGKYRATSRTNQVILSISILKAITNHYSILLVMGVFDTGRTRNETIHRKRMSFGVMSRFVHDKKPRGQIQQRVERIKWSCMFQSWKTAANDILLLLLLWLCVMNLANQTRPEDAFGVLQTKTVSAKS